MNVILEEHNKVEREIQLSSDSYSIEFWNKFARGIQPAEDKISVGKTKNGMYDLPMDSSREYQAAPYYNIGMKKLRRLAEDNLGVFSVYSGNRYLIVKTKFEDFIQNSLEI